MKDIKPVAAKGLVPEVIVLGAARGGWRDLSELGESGNMPILTWSELVQQHIEGE